MVDVIYAWGMSAWATDWKKAAGAQRLLGIPEANGYRLRVMGIAWRVQACLGVALPLT